MEIHVNLSFNSKVKKFFLLALYSTHHEGKTFPCKAGCSNNWIYYSFKETKELEQTSIITTLSRSVLTFWRFFRFERNTNDAIFLYKVINDVSSFVNSDLLKLINFNLIIQTIEFFIFSSVYTFTFDSHSSQNLYFAALPNTWTRKVLFWNLFMFKIYLCLKFIAKLVALFYSS